MADFDRRLKAGLVPGIGPGARRDLDDSDSDSSVYRYLPRAAPFQWNRGRINLHDTSSDSGVYARSYGKQQCIHRGYITRWREDMNFIFER